MLIFQYICRDGYDRQRSQVYPTDSTVQMAMPGTDNCQWIAALMAFGWQQTVMVKADLNRSQSP